MPAWHPDQFGPRRPAGRADGRSGQDRLVLITGQDQQRAPDPARVPSRPVETKAKGRTGGDLLPPVRVPAVRIERPAAILAIRRGEHRDGSRRPGEPHQPGLTAGQGADGVGDAQAGEAEHGGRLLVPRRVARRRRPVGVRRLGDRRSQARVVGGDPEHVACRGGKAPDRDPGRVDSGPRPGAADRGPPVGELLADALHLARLPAALAQVAVVEGQDAEPGLGEPPGEQVGSRLLGHREAAGHDHAAAVGPRVVPGRALGVAAREPDFLPFHGCPRIDVQRYSFLSRSEPRGSQNVYPVRPRRPPRGPMHGLGPRTRPQPPWCSHWSARR